jgi:hypothetical protein
MFCKYQRFLRHTPSPLLLWRPHALHVRRGRFRAINNSHIATALQRVNGRATMERAYPKEELGEADGDLSSWEYLTKVYDFNSSLTDHVMASPMMNAASLEAVDLSTSPDMTPQTTALPQIHVSTNVVLDVTNPTALFLPMQTITMYHPSCSLPMSFTIGPMPLPTRLLAQTSNTPFYSCSADNGPPHDEFSAQRAKGADNSALVPSLHVTLDQSAPHSMQAEVISTLHDSNIALTAPSTMIDRLYQLGGPPPVGRGITGVRTSLRATFARNPSSTTSTSNQSECVALQPNLVAMPAHARNLCKPMSAYNYFYRDERLNILNGMKAAGDPLPEPVSDFSQSKLKRLLHERW